jgi:hypothetical protein
MIMDKYFRAVVEYEQMRLSIKRITEQISQSISDRGFDGDIYYDNKKCTCGLEDDCFRLLYEWRKKNKIHGEWELSPHEYEEPESPSGDHEPTLCAAGVITDELISKRRLARRAFGIAKTRISQLGKPFCYTVCNPEKP